MTCSSGWLGAGLVGAEGWAGGGGGLGREDLFKWVAGDQTVVPQGTAARREQSVTHTPGTGGRGVGAAGLDHPPVPPRLRQP